MNTLVTPAIGEPNSFLRRVQVDPTIAMDLYREVKKVTRMLDCPTGDVNPDLLVSAVELLEQYVRGFEKLHNLEQR